MHRDLRRNAVVGGGSLIVVTALLLSGCTGASTTSGDSQTDRSAASGSLSAVCDAAADESGEAIWYESSLPEQGQAIVAAFHEKYPDVGVVHQNAGGGGGIASQVVQELQAGARTADLITGSPQFTYQLGERGDLLEFAPEDIGVTDPQLMPSTDAVLTVTSVPVIIYNINLVDEGQLDGSWEQLLDEEWAGKILIWNRFGVNVADLIPEWGEDRARDFAEQLKANKPIPNENPFSIAQEVGSGTSPVGIGFYHTTEEVIDSGAPVEMLFPDPVPIGALYSGIIKESPNNASAQCFLGWLVSEEGARAYEKITYRGNYLIPGTETHQMLDGANTSMFDYADVAAATDFTVELNELFAQ